MITTSKTSYFLVRLLSADTIAISELYSSAVFITFVWFVVHTPEHEANCAG